MYYDSIYKVMSKIDDEESLVDEIHNLNIKIPLLENTYGMTSRQQKHTLEQTLYSTRMLDIIINNLPMNPGFTLHSNESGTTIDGEKRDKNNILHHLTLARGKGSKVVELPGNVDHNALHKDLVELVRDIFKKEVGVEILNNCYKIYTDEHDAAHNKLKNKVKEDPDSYYSNIGNQLKAYENYFRNVKEELYKKTDQGFFGDKLDELIAKYNTFAELEPTATDIGKINPYIK